MQTIQLSTRRLVAAFAVAALALSAGAAVGTLADGDHLAGRTWNKTQHVDKKADSDKGHDLAGRTWNRNLR